MLLADGISLLSPHVYVEWKHFIGDLFEEVISVCEIICGIDISRCFNWCFSSVLHLLDCSFISSVTMLSNAKGFVLSYSIHPIVSQF